MIGVYMILGSDSEETIKKQRKQFTYAIIGFLFINIPNVVYTIFSPDTSASLAAGPDYSATYG